MAAFGAVAGLAAAVAVALPVLVVDAKLLFPKSVPKNNLRVTSDCLVMINIYKKTSTANHFVILVPFIIFSRSDLASS